MRVAAFGRTHWLHAAIRAVRAAGNEIAAIASAPPAPEYRVGERDFEQLAHELGCLYARSLDELPPADAAISVNWPALVPQHILERFARGVLNAHAGDLPRFRGNAAPNWAILTGEPRVVLTVHRMDGDIDSGPVLVRRELPLTEDTYIGDVYDWLDDVIGAAFVEALAAEPRPQAGEPLRVLPRRPEDGLLDWTRSADELARLVRASSRPFAGAFTYLGDERLVVWRARAEPLRRAALGVPGQVAEVREGTVAVLTGSGLLVLEEVELRGETGPPSDALRSVRTRLGLDTARLVERVRSLEERLRSGP